jgi:GNAT superfamily N-acetyltransferase
MLELLDQTNFASPLQDIKGMSEAEFLGGPGREESDIVIDLIFAGTLEHALEALSFDANISLEDGKSPSQDEWPERGRCGEFSLREPQDPTGCYAPGIVAIHMETGMISGAYVGCSLAVDPEHRSQGLGTALVMLRFLIDESLPLWDHDTPGFSPQGDAVHRQAFDELRSIRA